VPRVLIPPTLSPATFAGRDASGQIGGLEGRTMGTSWSAQLIARAADLPAFFHVLQAGMDVARSSGGAFDPAIGALVDLWGFGPSPLRPDLPTDADIAAALATGGCARLELDRPAQRVRQPGGLRLDLSGIAKGHGVDAVAERLLAIGLRHFLVEVGGELRGEGIKPDGRPWWVAFEAPPGAQLLETRIALHGLSVATSGDYRRYLDHQGERLPHSLDPRTGRPCTGGLASVTVLHPSCMIADAYATALIVMGEREGPAFAEAEGLAALFVSRTGDGFEETLTPALAAMLD